MRLIHRLLLIVLLLFVLPALVSLAVWQADTQRPQSWRQANWSSAGILPEPSMSDGPVIHVMAARTGRWKGGFSVHSWIVTRARGEAQYHRHEVVGWGKPVRHNAYAADARWYSNDPEIVATLSGEAAARLLPKVRKAIAEYPHAKHGSYRIWPGPNSNTFVSHVLGAVPELGLVTPPNAVGRTFIAGNGIMRLDPDWSNLEVSAWGYAGFAVGRRHGFEIHFMGLVTGFDILNPAIKLPGFGRIGL